MTQWSLDVDGVFTVLRNTETASNDVTTAFGVVTTAQENLAASLGELAGVAAALDGLVQSESDRVTRISNHISAGILGAGNATVAYSNADTEMAANAQSQAIDAADSGDFSAFGEG